MKRLIAGLVVVVVVVSQTGRLEGVLQASTFSYADFSDVSDLTFVQWATTNQDRLRLNDGTTGGNGAAWTTQKHDVAWGFSTSYTFRIGDLHTRSGADNFYFAIQNADPRVLLCCNSVQEGHSGPGVFDYRNQLKIELDTFQNPWDSSNWHLDVDSVDESGNFSHLMNNVHLAGGKNTELHRMDVVYNATAGQLQIYFDNSLYVDLNYDLSTAMDLDKGQAWVGFYGSSGAYMETHDVHTWDWQSTTNPVPEPSTLILCSLIAFCGIGIVRHRMR